MSCRQRCGNHIRHGRHLRRMLLSAVFRSRRDNQFLQLICKCVKSRPVPPGATISNPVALDHGRKNDPLFASMRPGVAEQPTARSDNWNSQHYRHFRRFRYRVVNQRPGNAQGENEKKPDISWRGKTFHRVRMHTGQRRGVGEPRKAVPDCRMHAVTVNDNRT